MIIQFSAHETRTQLHTATIKIIERVRYLIQNENCSWLLNTNGSQQTAAVNFIDIQCWLQQDF